MISRRSLLAGMAVGITPARAQFLSVVSGASFAIPATANILYYLNAGVITGVSDGAAVMAGDWVDQSLNARGALSSIAGAVYRSSSLGKPCVEFDGVSGSCAVSPAITKPATHRIFMVIKSVDGQGRLYDGSSVNTGAIGYNGGAGNSLGLQASLAFTCNAGGGEKTTSFTVIDGVFNGALSSMQVNASSVITGNPGVADATTGITLAAAGSKTALNSNVQIFEFLICNASISATDVLQIRGYLLNKYSANHGQRFIICGGNSLTAGTGSTGPTKTYPAVLAAKYKAAALRLTNAGEANATTPQVDAAGAVYDTQRSGYGCTLADYVAWEITNDLLGGSTGIEAYANWVTLCQNRQSGGWVTANRGRVVSLTCLPRSIFDATQETYRNYVNDNIRANYQNWSNVLVDVAAIPQLANPLNTNYYIDGTHLTDAGYQLIADAVFSSIG